MRNVISLCNLDRKILSINFEDILLPSNINSLIDCGKYILILLNFNQEHFNTGNDYIVNYRSNIWCIESSTNSIKWASSSLYRTQEYFIYFDLIGEEIYAVTNKKNLYKLDKSNGEIIKHF